MTVKKKLNSNFVRWNKTQLKCSSSIVVDVGKKSTWWVAFLKLKPQLAQHLQDVISLLFHSLKMDNISKITWQVLLTLCLGPHKSPGQPESQVNASWKLRSTCDSVWLSLRALATWDELHGTTLVEIEIARKSKPRGYSGMASSKTQKSPWTKN